jgi:hypothetical protein
MIRMDQTRAVKNTSESGTDGGRKMGTLRFKWLEDVKNDLGELKMKKWR